MRPTCFAVRCLLSVSCVLLSAAEAAKAGDELPPDLAPYFTVPAEFREDFGRFSALPPCTGPADRESQRAALLRDWTGLLGAWPKLNDDPYVEILADEDLGEYRKQTVRFEWLPGQFTTGYLLLPPPPESGGLLPGVVTVFYEPETAIGEGSRPDRDFARQLARRGFAALSIGTTETTANQTYSLYYPDISDSQLQPLSALACAAANAWHVLASRTDVDSERIGIVGHSYGGKWALFAGALWDRFAAVAVSDPGIVFDTHPSVNYWEPWYLGYHPTPWQRRRGLITPDNPAFGLYPRLLQEKRDLHELHALICPRPFLVSGGEVDPPERWRALNHSVRLNAQLGYVGRIGMTNRSSHAPTPESNRILCRFFEHFLRDQERDQERDR